MKRSDPSHFRQWKTLIIHLLCFSFILFFVSILLFVTCDFRFIPNSGCPRLSVLEDQYGAKYVLVQYQPASPIPFHYSYFYGLRIDYCNKKIILGEWNRGGLFNPFVRLDIDTVPYRVIPPLEAGTYEVYNHKNQIGTLIVDDTEIQWLPSPDHFH